MEYSDFSSGMSRSLTIFDAARAPEAQTSTSKVKAKPKARALTMIDTYGIIADLNDKNMLHRCLRMLVKQYCDHGLPVDAAVVPPRDGLKPMYDVGASKVNPFLRWVPGVVPDSACWDLQAMEPWSLSYLNKVSFAFKAKVKRHHALMGYDVVSGGVCMKQEMSKRQHGDKFNEVVTEEGLAKRPYMVTVDTDGCRSMSLLRAAVLGCGINHVYLPPFSPADNSVEGVINAATALLSAMPIGGGITSRTLGTPPSTSPGCASSSHMHSAVSMQPGTCGGTTLVLTPVCTVSCHSAQRAWCMFARCCVRSAARRSTPDLNPSYAWGTNTSTRMCADA